MATSATSPNVTRKGIDRIAPKKRKRKKRLRLSSAVSKKKRKYPR